jgi:hypothetical protein
MRRRRGDAVAFLLAVTAATLVAGQTAHAQFIASSKNFIFDAGYAVVKGKESDRSLDGFGFRASFEQSNYGGNFAGGGSFLVLRADDTAGEGADRVNLNYGNFIASIFGKWLFGPPRFRGNVVGSFGVQLGRLETSGELGTVENEDSGFTAGLSVGLYSFLSDTTFVNAAYDFQWLDNSHYQNGLVHFFRLGIGFQYD